MNRILEETEYMRYIEPGEDRITLLKIGLVIEKFSPYTILYDLFDDILPEGSKYQEIFDKFLDFENTNTVGMDKLYRKGMVDEISNKRLFLIDSNVADMNSVIKIFKKYEDGRIIRDFLDRNEYSQIKILILDKPTKREIISILQTKNWDKIYEIRWWLEYYVSKYLTYNRDVDYEKYFTKRFNLGKSDREIEYFTSLMRRLFRKNDERYYDDEPEEIQKLNDIDIATFCVYDMSDLFAIEYILDTIPRNISDIVKSEIEKRLKNKLKKIPSSVIPKNDVQVYNLFFHNIIPNLTVNVGLDYNSLKSHRLDDVMINSLKRLDAIQSLSKIFLTPITINYKRNGFIKIKRKFPIRTEIEKKALISKWTELFATELYEEMEIILKEITIEDSKRTVPDFVSENGNIRIRNPRLRVKTKKRADGSSCESYFITGDSAIVHGKEKGEWSHFIDSKSAQEYMKIFGTNEDNLVSFFEIIDLPNKKRLIEILETNNSGEFTRNRKAYKILLIKYLFLMNYKLKEYKTYRLLKMDLDKLDSNTLEKFIQLMKRVVNKDFLSEIPENILEMPIRNRFPYYERQYLKNKEYDLVYWQGIV